MSEPIAFFLTWTCYGTWLHGDTRGSVDRDHNVPKTAYLQPNSRRQTIERSLQAEEANQLTKSARDIVESTIAKHCRIRDWTLHAVNARSNHVHVVLSAPNCTPERMMIELKAWCTRRLREAGEPQPSRHVWTKHGSTRYLWNERSLMAAIEYTQDRQ